MPSEQVNTMRFRSELLRPPKGDPEPVLTKIYDVYRSPDGHIAGEGQSMAEVLEGSEASTKKDFRPKSF